jgi:hypothetical protein
MVDSNGKEIKPGDELAYNSNPKNPILKCEEFGFSVIICKWVDTNNSIVISQHDINDSGLVLVEKKSSEEVLMTNNQTTNESSLKTEYHVEHYGCTKCPVRVPGDIWERNGGLCDNCI